ncbi:glutamyl-tRNA reductase [Streptomyces sp. NPDC020801]|uniref:glutamyl-tRNA reductase n=1 Tax=unclassified Streptomyces TaxID=2593676 RepID=UPI00379C5E0D
MSLLVVGLSHRSAPVAVLERVSLNADAQTKLLQDTVAAEPATEATLLATCNRIELYADVDKFHAGVAELSTLLAQHSGVALEELTPYLYVHYEDRAVHHLFSVACGLDSMVVGEGQILGQIKDSLARAQDLHTAGRLLNDLFQQALRVGKRAHSETGIDRAGQSLVTFGLEQLSQGADVQAWARGKKALVIGAGSMSSLAAATLARAGVAEIVIANRTQERAERLAQILAEGDDTDVRARAVPMNAVPVELTRADVAVSCTGATGIVLTAETIAAAVEGRSGAPVAVEKAGTRPGTRTAGARTGAEDAQDAQDAQDTDGPDSARATARADLKADLRETPLPPATVGAEEGCPLDLAAVEPGFSLMGESAVAGMDAATLEQHGTWVGGGTSLLERGRELGGGAVDRRESARRSAEADAGLIAALAATVATVGRIPERRKPEPVATAPRPEPVLFLLDLAMPRDVDAAVHRLAGARLVDIEFLAEASADAPMASDVDQVRRIVSDEVAAFGAAQRAAHITPTVVALRTMAADVVAGEIARLEGRLPGMDDKHRAEITQTVRRVVDKLLHAPTVRVKQLAAEPGGAGYADALRTLFDLDPETVASVSRAEESTEEKAKNRGPA